MKRQQRQEDDCNQNYYPTIAKAETLATTAIKTTIYPPAAIATAAVRDGSSGTCCRYRRLREIQIGMSCDIVVRVVAFDQQQQQQSRFFSRRRRRSGSTKTQTFYLVADGPDGTMDELPFLLHREGYWLRFNAILQRHYHLQQQQHQQKSCSTSLLRLTNIKCQAWSSSTVPLASQQQHVMDNNNTRNNYNYYHHQCKADHCLRVLVPTRQTQAMDVVVDGGSMWLYEDDNINNGDDDINSNHCRIYSASLPAQVQTQTPHPPPPPPPSLLSVSKQHHQTGIDVCKLNHNTEKQLCDHDGKIIILESLLLDIRVVDVGKDTATTPATTTTSLLHLPPMQWMNQLIQITDDKSTTTTTSISTFQPAILTLQHLTSSSSLGVRCNDPHINHRLDTNAATDGDHVGGPSCNSSVLYVWADGNIVQTLCGGLSAAEITSSSSSSQQYSSMATQLLESLLPQQPRHSSILRSSQHIQQHQSSSSSSSQPLSNHIDTSTKNQMQTMQEDALLPTLRWWLQPPCRQQQQQQQQQVVGWNDDNPMGLPRVQQVSLAFGCHS